MAGVVVANHLEGMKFTLGPSMAVRRDCLRAIGGFGAMADYLADDFVLGQWASVGSSSGPEAVLARDVMTQPAITIRGSASLREAAQLMTEHHVARLVVVGDDSDIPLGLISDSDLMREFRYTGS